MPTTAAPTLRQRRERLGISRERLARAADVSYRSVELLELGYSPKRSRVLPLIMGALARLEAERELSTSTSNGAPAANGDPVKNAEAGGERVSRV
ncbi:MAG TPA: hypothetical protein VMG37_00030 [Solirubrobacteraceae bacterium]|nr:hypothetical protein [Solirubrobacteraceae bacterium]